MKRYSLWQDPMTAYQRGAIYEMKEFSDGDWVRQEDVDLVIKQHAEMLEALEMISKEYIGMSSVDIARETLKNLQGDKQ